MLIRILVFSLFFSFNLYAGIKSYFNNSDSGHYTDPYRQVTKSGANFEQLIIDQLNLAQVEVVVAVQEFRLPILANKLIELSNKGIKVRLILEDKYNYSLPELIKPRKNTEPSEPDLDYDLRRYEDLFQLVDINKNGRLEQFELASRDAIFMLRKHNISIKDDTADGSQGSALMHHKFIVIDNKKVIATSANFTLSDIHGDYTAHKTTGNANALVVIDDTAVAKAFTTEFDFMWGNSNSAPRFGVKKPFRGANRFILNDGTKITLQFSPSPRNTMFNLTTNGLIASNLARAKSSIEAALFVFSEQRLSSAMQIGAKNGARVNILVDRLFASRYYSELLDIWGIALRRTDTCEYEDNNNPWPFGRDEFGGSPRLVDGDMLHHKFAVIDKTKVLFGSHNWSNSANHMNDEFLMVIEDKKIAGEFSSEHTRLTNIATYGPSNTLLKRIAQLDEFCNLFHPIYQP
jgi:phosphatidylserine/phosphatidylglycerophosphate/cardiolipin synthase-like enzyme